MPTAVSFVLTMAGADFRNPSVFAQHSEAREREREREREEGEREREREREREEGK